MILVPYFASFPGELEDAARIDGANAWQVFTRIVLPLSQPVLAALAIFAFRSAWNDFLWPLIALALASLSAYTIARLKVRWTQTLLQMSAMSRMVPLIVLMVPLYVLFRTYGLLNSLSGVILA